MPGQNFKTAGMVNYKKIANDYETIIDGKYMSNVIKASGKLKLKIK